MKRTTTGISSKLVALLAGAAMFGLVSQSALAAGTQSGTSISNTATLNYSVGSVTQTAITSAAAAFTVDDKVNVLVAGGVITNVTPGQSSAVTPFTVTNNGNATQGYALAAADAASGAYTVNATPITDNFNPVPAYKIYVDTNANGVLDAAELAAGVVTSIPTLAAGATVNLLVLTDIAASPTRVNGDAAVVSLKASTLWPTPLVASEEPAAVVAGAVVVNTAGANTAGVDVVFADAAGAVEAATDGAHSTYGAFKVVSSALSVAKIVTVICDPINGSTNPKNIPGAVVQYAVTITNGVGAASATLTTVTDTLVAQLGFEPKLINGAGAGSLCSSATGTALSATTGFSAVRGTGTTTTTYAAPGAAAQATTAGATIAGQAITIDFATLAGTAYGAADAVLPANSYVTVYFNAIVQ